MANPKIRLATSSPGTGTTTKGTLAQLGKIASRAASERADILLLPEAYLGGYPRGLDFGCKVGARTAEGRDDYLQHFKDAVDLGDTVGNGAGAGTAWVRRRLGSSEELGDQENGISCSDTAHRRRGDGTREELEKIAKGTGVFIVTGLVEKAGGSLYCAIVYVCPRLGIIGKRRKVMPTGTERLIWAQGSPATLKAVSTTIKGVRINLAAAICWESYMPLLRQSLYAQNINLYLAPTADGRDAWLPLMRTVALEGRCFVVSSCMCVPSKEKLQKKENISISNGEVNGLPTQDEHPMGRRNSCFTEEGFEIALPSASSANPRTERRKSVLDEDGHEIVLCDPDTSAVILEEEEKGHDNGATAAASGSTPEPHKHTAGSGAQGPTASTTGKKAAKFVSRGGSSIVSPSGDVLAGPQWEDEEGIIYADVDFEDCIRGRLDLDTAGSYSRNDSFKFSVEGLDLDPLPY
ncbi:carbon-nitrogen hydrolase [Xylariales sp. AK1849]|nr:carbon-nitrogen hydrolase [Xylariales sp. AK1849]